MLAANACDSCAVLCSKGRGSALSRDHTPRDQGERTRIIAAGGFVENGCACNNLALSHAFGDFEYKKNPNLKPEEQIMTADPEIFEHDISEDDEFFVLGCDGIWDCLSSQDPAFDNTVKESDTDSDSATERNTHTRLPNVSTKSHKKARKAFKDSDSDF